MTNVDRQLQQTYGQKVPKFLTEYMLYVDSLTYDERPDYQFCRDIFKKAFRSYCETNRNMILDANELKQELLYPSTRATRSVNLASKFKASRDTISPVIFNSRPKLLLDSGADVSLIKDKLIINEKTDISDTIALTGIG